MGEDGRGPLAGGAVAAPRERIAGVRRSRDDGAAPRLASRRLGAMSLVSPEELLDRIDDPTLRIADVRWWLADPGKGRRDYDEAHLPGAIFVDVDTDLVASEGPGRHPLPTPAAFAARMAALGFDDSSDIVAYDDAGGTIAVRLWWMLDVLGHPRVRVLDGGIGAWIAAGGPGTAAGPPFPPGGAPPPPARGGPIAPGGPTAPPGPPPALPAPGPPR